jgi:hypothetical protein
VLEPLEAGCIVDVREAKRQARVGNKDARPTSRKAMSPSPQTTRRVESGEKTIVIEMPTSCSGNTLTSVRNCPLGLKKYTAVPSLVAASTELSGDTSA